MFAQQLNIGMVDEAIDRHLDALVAMGYLRSEEREVFRGKVKKAYIATQIPGDQIVYINQLCRMELAAMIISRSGPRPFSFSPSQTGMMSQSTWGFSMRISMDNRRELARELSLITDQVNSVKPNDRVVLNNTSRSVREYEEHYNLVFSIVRGTEPAPMLPPPSRSPHQEAELVGQINTVLKQAAGAIRRAKTPLGRLKILHEVLDAFDPTESNRLRASSKKDREAYIEKVIESGDFLIMDLDETIVKVIKDRVLNLEGKYKDPAHD